MKIFNSWYWHFPMISTPHSLLGTTYSDTRGEQTFCSMWKTPPVGCRFWKVQSLMMLWVVERQQRASVLRNLNASTLDSALAAATAFLQCVTPQKYMFLILLHQCLMWRYSVNEVNVAVHTQNVHSCVYGEVRPYEFLSLFPLWVNTDHIVSNTHLPTWVIFAHSLCIRIPQNI